jgi:hypothetical protein
MKKLFFLLTAISLLTSCDKDGQVFAGKDQLPPETQTGANTVGCLVNGKVFLPHQEGINPALECNYEFLNGKFYFNLYYSDLRNGGVRTVGAETRQSTLQVGQTYILNKNVIKDGDFIGGGQYYISSILTNNFYTNTINNGELRITHLDLQNSIISGTFWFDAVNSKGEKTEIREGRFDMEY